MSKLEINFSNYTLQKLILSQKYLVTIIYNTTLLKPDLSDVPCIFLLRSRILQSLKITASSIRAVFSKLWIMTH